MVLLSPQHTLLWKCVSFYPGIRLGVVMWLVGALARIIGHGAVIYVQCKRIHIKGFLFPLREVITHN